MKDAKNNNNLNQQDSSLESKPPKLKISKIGIVSRDYRENNGNSDFSESISEILNYLDKRDCDSVLFSLFTILEKNSLKTQVLDNLEFKNLKSIFIEEYKFENNIRNVIEFKTYYRRENNWKIYRFKQKFAKLEYTKTFESEVITPFIKEVNENRIMGSCMALLCGETNIVKYSKQNKKVEDKFMILDNIPTSTNIILNPIHDIMTRFEMKMKRQYLSLNNRIVISVWNKGKLFSDKTRDGLNPPWTIYSDGQQIFIDRENIEFHNKNSKIEIGILDIEREFRRINKQ